MNILVSNDDGIKAEGLQVLVEALASLPDNNVYVCAPDGQRSACGHGITMTQPIMIKSEKVEGAVWAESISGTPADCVKSAVKRLKNEQNIKIDAVFSGINHGGNIGSDVFYSGTVAAAIEGVLCGIPAVAVSLGTHTPTTPMLKNCTSLIKDVCKYALPEIQNKTLLNINFPAIPPETIKGIKVTELGPREYNEKFQILEAPGKRRYYWYTGSMVEYTGLPDEMDVMAQQEGFISITPLKLDLTDYELREKVRSWNLNYSCNKL